jgi:acylphosphatase
MKSKIVISGSRVHEVGFRLILLQYAKKFRFFHFEAFNDISDCEEQVIVFVEGDEENITSFVEKIQFIKPESAIVHTINVEKYEGDILAISSFSQDLQMEQMAKAVPILVEMKGMQEKTIGLQEKTLGLQEITIGLQEKSIGLQEKTIGLQEKTIGLQEKTLGLQEKTIGLQEKSIDLQLESLILHKQSIGLHHDSLKKQDETLIEIRGLRGDIHSTFDVRLTKIEESLHTIKSALEQAKILG